MRKKPLSVVSLERTCRSCPSQWEGYTEDGRVIRVRYAWGFLTIGVGADIDEAVDSRGQVFKRQLAYNLDGFLTYNDLKQATHGVVQWPQEERMSMYNLMFGQSKAAPLLLTALGVTREECGRYRDCYLTENGEIAIYTRNGGGNREGYADVFERLSKHECYLRDEDDTFDSTYATIYFRVPETMNRAAFTVIEPELNRDEAWQMFLEALRKAETK